MPTISMTLCEGGGTLYPWRSCPWRTTVS